MLCTKIATERYSPAQVVALHAPISAVVLFVWLRGHSIPADWSTAWTFAGFAVISGIGGGFLFNAGLRHIAAPLAGVLTYLEPLVATMVGALALGEALPGQAWGGLAVVLAAGAWAVSA